MRAHTLDMTVGSPARLLLRFSLPLFVGNLFQQVYNLADTAIAGHLLGDAALSQIGATAALYSLITTLAFGLNSGFALSVSRHFGANDRKRMEQSVCWMVTLSALCAAVMTAVFLLSRFALADAMQIPADTREGALAYLTVILAGIPLTMAYNLESSLMQSVGNSITPLLFLVFSSILNIALDLLFVGVFHWGVWSAALATSISQFVSLGLCIFRLCHYDTVYRVCLRKIRFHLPMLKQVIHFGLPSGVQNSIIAFANVIVQSNINAFGSNAMAGCGTYAKLEGFAFLPITCFTMALTTFVSQNLGAHQYDRVKKGVRFGIVCSTTLAECIGVVLFLLAEPLVAIFQNDPAVIEIGVRQAHVEALFFCFLAFAHCIAGIMRGAGKPMVPMFIMLAIWCVLRVAYISIVVPLVAKIDVIFTAYPLTWGVSCIIFLIYFLKSDWLHNYDRLEQKKALL